MMTQNESRQAKQGKVYLIGSGPGDPGLITVKGRKILDRADCIIYDFLAPGSLLGNNTDAELICVGKSGKSHTMEQDEINRLLVRKAREGKLVARLKGGDPFIFGRGGEEALALAAEGVSFEIVPGVSSAYGVPAYAGIPVTHRGMTTSVSFITGHEDPTKDQSDLDWEKISTAAGTLVFLMGVKNLPMIASNLVKYGRSPDEEVALIRWGTTARQQTVTGTLENIAAMAAERDFTPPAIIVVGKVVSLRSSLAWFDRLPLFGKTFIVTRTREQAGALTEKLMEAGAEVFEVPTIKIEDPATFHSLDESIDTLKGRHYRWVIFTSPNGVRKFFERLQGKNLDTRVLAGVAIAVIGPSTAEALKEFGLIADLMPESFRAEGILEKMSALEGEKILLVRAQEARDILPESLREKGNSVDIAVAYRTVAPPESRKLLGDILRERSVDLVTFTSSSTAENFAALIQDRLIIEKMKCVSIGPITSATARDLGFDVILEADEYTIEGLVNTILHYFTKG
jgi:uroporphyrinogen III methyltransferase / synthase